MRQFKQFLKIVVVGSLIGLLSIDVTLACGLMRKACYRCRPRICAPPPVCGYGWGGYPVRTVYYSTGETVIDEIAEDLLANPST